MAQITITCQICGSKLVSAELHEALQFDRDHKAKHDGASEATR